MAWCRSNKGDDYDPKVYVRDMSGVDEVSILGSVR